MDVDNPMMSAVTTISPPTRGYSPYNRSQSEEHILSPCRDLLKSAEFSPVSYFVIDTYCPLWKKGELKLGLSVGGHLMF
jgi:hypothetical protein